MLNAHQLHVFLIAAETRNFTQAAAHLQMTQPSVSQHIQALEQHFGLGLFLRSGRSLELTEAGQALVPLARELFNLSEHIGEVMESVKGEVSGHLMLGCSTTVGRYVLPQLLSAFHSQYPKVRSTCHVSSSEISLENLLQGKIQLALTSEKQTLREIEYRRLLTEEIYLTAPLNHPWAIKGSIDPQDLYDVEFILPEEGSDIYTVLDAYLSSLGVSIYQLKNIITLGSAEAVALAVREGLGIGFVSSVVYRRLIPQEVAIISIHGAPIYQEIYVARNVGRHAGMAQSAFWDYLFCEENVFLKAFDLCPTPNPV